MDATNNDNFDSRLWSLILKIAVARQSLYSLLGTTVHSAQLYNVIPWTVTEIIGHSRNTATWLRYWRQTS